MACGTLIENIRLLAAESGRESRITYFPEGEKNIDFVATIVFIPNNNIKKDPLCDFIAMRVTNRKPYGSKALTQSEKDDIFAAGEDAEIKFYLIEEKNTIQLLANSASINERLVFSNKYIHSFFFDHIRWTKYEDDLQKNGFFIKVLELPFAAQIAMRFLRHWGIMKFLNKFNAAKNISKQSAHTNMCSAGIGMLGVKEYNNLNFIKLGRSLQRIWLTATQHGLSFQPISGLIFLSQHLGENGTYFDSNDVELIKNSMKNITHVFGSEYRPGMMFRIGTGVKPSDKSPRMAPMIEYA